MNRFLSITVFLLLLSTVCWAGGNKEKDEKPTSQNNQQTFTEQSQVQQRQTAPQQQVNPQPIQQTQPASKYWTGDGGKGKSIVIVPPDNLGLAESQKNLPEMLAVDLVNNFHKFSAMNVFDRVSNDRQYKELLSGYYADDDNASLDLGHGTSPDYTLSGNITRTSTSYVLQLKVDKNAFNEKTTVAAYSGTVSIAELENLSAVRKASLELILEMGVQLTAQAQTELIKPPTTDQLNSRNLTAQSMIAQRNGTVVEALTYAYQAASFDPSLLEAISLSSTLSASITSGNMGENIRNDIQRRNEWIKILDEADAFFKTHLPFEIVYDPLLTQGKIYYNNQTVDLSFQVTGYYSDTALKVLTDIRKGLIYTGRMKDWNIDLWPFYEQRF